MTRNELFDYIKANNLKEEVKAKFGKPYNSVATELLQDFVELIKQAEQTITSTPASSKDMSYKELKEFVKSNNLQDFAKSIYNKNYTNLSTEELRVIYEKSTNNTACNKIDTDECINGINKFVDIKARNVLKALCTILNQKDLLKLLN